MNRLYKNVRDTMTNEQRTPSINRPKRPRQSDIIKYPPYLTRRLSPPIEIQAIMIPGLRQRPLLL